MHLQGIQLIFHQLLELPMYADLRQAGIPGLLEAFDQAFPDVLRFQDMRIEVIPLGFPGVGNEHPPHPQ